MKIVLDTNCLVAIIPKKSEYRIVWDKILSGEIKLAITTEILAEYEEILASFYSESLAKNVVQKIVELKSTELITVFYNWELIKEDPDDNKFVDCAVAANARLIVTNDKHYNILDKIEFPKIEHIKLKPFCKMI